MRKPNLTEAASSFNELFASMKRDGNNQYAAFCLLAVARCEQAMSNTAEEAEKTVEAAQLFLQAEMENHTLNYAGYEEHLHEATQCYLQAIDLYVQLNRPLFAASLFVELAAAMKLFKRVDDAAMYCEKAARFQLLSPLAALSSLEEAVACKIMKKDYDGAILTLNEIINFALERFGIPMPNGETHCAPGAALDVISRAEVTRLLLLLLLQPSPHASKPDHAVVLEKFAADESTASQYMPEELRLLLQSLVLTCGAGDTAGASLLQADLWIHFTPLQNDLMQLIVTELHNGFLTKA
ncbi:hypothetical protein, variant [Capsaspora owczarzaki ATCC 30864]|nr:hypothetical protein, variant [Capsaspora owczarzaki ATCC 30864]